MPRVSGKEDVDAALAMLGAELRAKRKGRRISQEALADFAGIDRSHMGKIERGERNVTLLNLVRIATALDCKVSKLLEDAGLYRHGCSRFFIGSANPTQTPKAANLWHVEVVPAGDELK